MATNPYLNSDFSFNLKLIMNRAWLAAHGALAFAKERGWDDVTLRSAFAKELRRQWDVAKGCKANAVWIAERDALLATLRGRDLRIAELQQARICAVHLNSTAERNFSVAMIDRQIAQLSNAA